MRDACARQKIGVYWCSFVVRTILAVISTFALKCSALALSLSLSPADEAARDVALQWLGVVDSGNYKDAALLMSEQVRGSRDWTKYFAAHRAPLGRVNNRQIAEVKHASTVPGDPEVRLHAIVRFKTSFEHKAAAAEEIVLTKMGCCWEVMGYEVN
jgi:Protein of unknown function (DUF4019)